MLALNATQDLTYEAGGNAIAPGEVDVFEGRCCRR